jgi:hypothetical protein
VHGVLQRMLHLCCGAGYACRDLLHRESKPLPARLCCCLTMVLKECVALLLHPLLRSGRFTVEHHFFGGLSVIFVIFLEYFRMASTITMEVTNEGPGPTSKSSHYSFFLNTHKHAHCGMVCKEEGVLDSRNGWLLLYY